MRGIRLSLFFALLAWSPMLLAQEIPTPWSWPITSDYGPRDRDDGLALKWNFHEGIDYGGTAGESISAVEAGAIDAIEYYRGWYVAVKNVGVKPERRWTYMHIFSGTNPAIPVTSDNWELRSANLKKAGTTQIYTSNVIIRWSSKPELKSEKVLSIKDYDGMEVYIGTTPVLNTSGAIITSSGSVSKHDPIAPVGTSGDVDEHLHLGLDIGENNPLLYLAHSTGPITVDIVNPLDAHLFRAAEQNTPYPIKVRVDSTGGLDMDKLNLVIVDSHGSRHLVGHWSQPLFSYGGRSDREDFGGIRNSTTVALCGGGFACVEPLDANPSKPNNQPGLDDFTYKFPFGSLSLPDGEYSLEAVATDVNKNQYASLPRSFRIDTTQPFFHLSSISPLYDNFRGTSTLNPSTLERSHTLDFTDAVAGISALVVTGPEGFPGYSHVFEPPVSTTTLSFENMPLGPYEIRAVDAAGNESIAPFKIVDLSVEVSTPDSVFHGLEVTSTPTEYSEKFGCRLAVKTESSSPIERVDLFSIGNGENIPTLVKSIPGSEVGPVATFDTGINSDLFYSSNNYIVQVWNKDGNSRSRVFGVRGDSEQIPATEGTYSNTYFDGAFIMPQAGARQGTFSSQVVDLRSKTYLVGGTVFNSVPGFPYNAYNNIRNPDIISIPDGSSEKFYGLPIGGYQEIGTIEARLISSDSTDMSGGSDMLMGKRHYFAVSDPESYTNNGSTCGSAGILHWYDYCYTETKMSAGIFPLGRYVQSKLIFDMPAPSSILAGNCAVRNDSTCDEGYGFTIRGALLANYTGALIEPVYYYPAGENAILPGKNVKVPLGSGVYVNFDRIDSVGAMGLSVQRGETLPGFVSVPEGHSYNVTGGITFGEADISFPYEPSGLSAAQQSQIRVVRVTDSARGLFEVLPTTLDAGNKLVSAKVTSFGKLMVVAPAYATPHQLSEGSVGGGAELEFVSNAQVSLERISETSVYSGVMSKNLALNGLAPVGEVYYIGPDDTALVPAGAIRMRYDKAKLSSLGIPDTEIGLYEFSSDGSLLFKLPRQSINSEAGEIIAEVPKLYSLFGVLGKPYQPLPTDIMLPETLLEYDGTVYNAESGAVYITTSTRIKLTASDWDDEYKTGLLASYYFRDRYPDFVCLKTGRDITKPAGTCENPVYSEGFTLEEGSHTIYYQSVDNTKNFEFTKSTEVYVDATPPTVELLVGTSAVADGGTVYIAESDFVTLSYADPEVNHVASGVRAVYRLVDVAPVECAAVSPPVACEAVEYAGSLTLPAGPHTVYYFAADYVGNMSAVKSARVVVRPLDKIAPMVTAWAKGQALPVGGSGYVLSSDTVALVAVDDITPAPEIYYTIDSVFVSTGTALSYNSPFLLDVGTHILYYAAVDGAGNMSVIENTQITVDPSVPEMPVVVLDPKTYPYFKYETKFGSNGTLPGQFKSPVDADIDNKGNIYVLDSSGRRLQKFSPELTFISSWTLPVAQYESSYGLNFCADNYGGLYVASQYNLFKFTTEGNLVYTLNGFLGDAWIWSMTDIACGPNGEFYSPNASGEVLHFDLTGRYLGKFIAKNGSGLGGIAADANHDIYLSDFSTNIIRKFDAAGNLLLQWGSVGSGVLQFSNPRKMEVDSFDNLYVNDTGNNRISVFTSSGGHIAAFGSPSLPEFVGLQGSQGIGIDPNTGKIFVPNSSGRIDVFAVDLSSPAVPAMQGPRDGASVYSVSPLFTGRCKPGPQVEVLEYSTVIATAACDNSGWFLARSGSPLSYGPHRFSARAIDYKGFTSPETDPIYVTLRPLSLPRFDPPLNINAGFVVSGVVAGDFNSDKMNDVVALGEYSYRVFLNNGNSAFTMLPTSAYDQEIRKGYAGDFDKDGSLDIAVVLGGASYSPFFSVLWGNNDGTFTPSQPISILDRTIRDLSTGDFNNDGSADFAFAGNGVVVLPGNSDRTFQSPKVISAAWSVNIGVGDFNSDGRADLFANSNLYLGDGVGNFSESSPGFVCSQIVASLDMNGDLVEDLVAESAGDRVRKVYLGKGNAQFQLESIITADVVNNAYRKIDINADGNTDLAAVIASPGALKIFPNMGNGGFSSSVDLNSGSSSMVQALCGSDIDNDGLEDLLSAAYPSQVKVFHNSTISPDLAPPGDISDLGVAQADTGEIVLSWKAPGSNGVSGQASVYNIRVASVPITSETVFMTAVIIDSAMVPQVAGSTETFAVSGLASGTTYYFSIKAVDSSGNSSGISNSPGIYQRFLVKSTTTIYGNPEISLVASVQPFITQISTISATWAVAIGTASEQSLTLASNMYEISPEGDYNPPAALTFYYSTAAIAAVGLNEEDVFVCEHFEGSGWVKLDGQVKDTLNHKITVPISRIASLFGIFGMVQDRTAPVTDYSVEGSSWSYSGGVYVNAASSISLNAYDPVVFATSSGVGFTGFRVDAATSAPFETYVEPFRLSTGAHRVEFRSSDKAGNIEDIRFLSVIVDGEAPMVSYAVAGSSFAADNVMYVAAGSTVTLVSSDTASGVSALSYAVNGDTAASSGIAEIYLSSAGAYAIGYSAGDNVGNVMAHGLLSVYVDATAPVSALLLSGSHEIAPWYTSGVVAELSSSDMASGVQRALYRLDGSSFAVYAATFPVLSEGGHSLEFYSIDNVLNAENPRLVHFGIDISTPEATYTLMPVPNADGWNNAAVNVVFTGTDVVSGLAYCSSSFTVTGEGAGIPVSGYCSDYAGWTSTAVFALNIDTTVPLSQAGLAAVAGRNGWLVSPAVVQVTSTDSLSGLKNLYYSLDGSSFTLYSSSFPVTGEGEHRLKYYAVDKAGNTEAEKSLELKLDLAAPSVVAVSSPAANGLGWNNTAVTAVFSGTDAVSGLAYCEPEKLLALEGSSLPVSGYCMDHAGWTSTATVVVSIDTTAPVAAYSAAPAANEEGWNNTDVTLKFSCEDALSGIKTCPKDIILAAEGAGISISTSVKDNADNSASMTVAGIKIDRTAPVSTAAISGVSVNGWYSSAIDIVIASSDALSGIKGISYSLDGGEYLSSVSPLAVAAEGAHTLKYYAVDNAGNAEPEKSMEFRIDSSMPEVTFSQIPVPNGEGWNNTSVQVVFAGSDTVSGVMSCSSAAVTLEGAGRSVTGWCKDMAGNIAFATATVSIDLTRPAVSGEAVPAPNAAGWNNSDVAVEFTCADELSGIDVCPENILMVTEGVGLSTSAFAYDLAGNMGSAEVAGVKIDRTSPVSTAALTGVHRNGWYSSPVEVVLASTDVLAGIKEVLYSLDGKEYATYSMPLHVPGDGDHSLKYYALDNAGNMEAMKLVEFRIDVSRPEITYSQAPGANVKGWNNTSVQVVFSGSDTLSGIEACSSTTIAMEGAVQRVPGWCRDMAGNMAYATATLSIDLTNPDASAAVQPPPNAYGWHNGPVEVGFTGVDALSGLASCESPRTISIQGSSMPVSGSCVDNAGNSSSASLAVSIDTAAPSLSYSARPAPNAAGWNNTAVSMEFTCSDLLSGVRYCPGAITLAEEGAAISTAAAAYDYAGNGQQVEVSGIKIDKTAPVTRAELSGTLENDWYNTSVTLSLPAVDVLSGLSGISYRVEGPGYSAGELAYGAPVVFEADGRYTVYFYAVDKAGNREAEKSVSFKIDREIPAISYALVPDANAAGWNNASVRVVFSGADALSGVKECSGATVSVEGSGQKVVGHCSDNAGNVSYATATVNIDLTPAAITLNSPLAGQTYIATRGRIGLDFSVRDNLDAHPAVEAFLVQVEDRGSPRGGRPARIAVASGQSIEPLDIDDGLWRLAVSATDFADNAAYSEGGAFDVIHDVLAPRSALVTSGPVYRPAGGAYLTSAALFNLSSIDDLVAVADGIGLGVKNQSAMLKSGEQIVKELSFMNPLPKQGAAFASTFGFASLGTLADGLYSLTYRAEDTLANAELPKIMSFSLDNTPPFTGFNVTGASYETQDKVFVTGTSGLALAGVDVSSGGVASGLMLTKYKLDEGAWQVYAGSFSVTNEGQHTLAYYSLDHVQNIEASRTRSVVVDNTPPAASITLGAPMFEAFGVPVITPETPLALSAADHAAAGLASGLKSIHYELIGPAGGSSGVLNYTEPFRIAGQGTYIVRCWAADNVGNIGSPAELKVAVTALQRDALIAADGLDMGGSADISGRVEAGIAGLNGNARILGDVYASTITLKGKAQITGRQAALAAGFAAEPLEMAYIVARASAVNNNALVPARYIADGRLVVSANAELTLSTGVYCFTGMDLAGGAKIILDGKVEILVAGDVAIAGGSSFNAAGAASGANIFLSTRSALTFAGGGSLAANVYAPYSDLKLTGNALLGGHYFVRTAVLSGTGNILQAGETLPRTTAATGDTGGKNRVSAMAAGDAAYSVLSGPDPAFRLGEVYVYPNPALRGAAPVLHIETGIADSVKITIYTVSGRPAHEHTLTGMPVALDDGNGLSYAYEYVWRDSIPSGVYYYHIEAEKGGQKIRKSGKFAVVR